MVGIISSSGLGLFNSSQDVLGVALGQASLGQAKGGAYANLATGNLSIQFLDESLSGTGIDLFALRSYNSLGALNDGDADGWRWSGEHRLVLSGSVNTAGSSVTRTLGDGSQTVFSWNGSKYISTNGSGAHDSLVWNAGASEWVLTLDGSGVVERYNGSTGWIKSSRDASGAGFDFVFTADKLKTVKDAGSGQTFEFVYGANGKLERLDTRTTAGGALTRQVYYAYDASGRLSTVKTDLTPVDNSITDNNVYTTSYTYHGTSLRIASISQSDGTSVSYTYDTSNRIYKVTDQTGVNTFTYDTANRKTTVSNTAGERWDYSYNTLGQLTDYVSAVVNNVSQSASYTYDPQGNVKTIKDGRENIINYDYDANGNRIKEYDALGNTVTRTYSAASLLLTETRYSISSLTSPGGAETTRYVYDAANRLRFVVSAEGRVSESRYNAQGLLVSTHQYTSAAYAVGGLAATTALTEAQLNTWVSGLTATQKSQTQVSLFEYDYRGNLNKKTDYATVNTSGTGVLDSAADVTEYVYSEHGQLLQTIAVRGATRTAKTILSSQMYDGMGRLESVINEAGTTTTSYSGVNITVNNLTSGLKLVSTTDAYGRLTSVTQTGNATNRITKHVYDTAGRLRMTEDPTGARTYVFYDLAGRVNARVDSAGAVTVYTHDADGRVLTEVRYANAVATSIWYNGTTVTKTSLTVGTSSADADVITDTTNDRKTTYTYDASGRLSTTAVDGVATVTNTYDGASRLVKTTQGDRITRYFYDKDGHQIGMLNAERYLTQYVYDKAGRLTVTVRYGGTPASVAQQASATFDGIRTSVNNGARLTTYYFYDAEGRQVGSVDEQGFLTETVYDAQNNRRVTKQYKAPVTVAESNTFEILETLAAIKARAGSSNSTTTQYDAYGRVSTVTTTDGTVSRNVYDTAGRLIRQTQADGTTEQRAVRTRYNAFGEVTGVVSGVGEATLAASPEANAIDTAITSYGTRYQIDGVGRRVTELGPNGQKTFLFYNAAGQLTYTMNALGEVSKTTYNTFGQVKEIRVYNTRLTATNLATITAGGSDSNISGKVVADTTNDKVIRTTYKKFGMVATQTDAEGFITTNTYTTYGQLNDTTRTIASGVTVKTLLEYDLLGRVRHTTGDVGGLAAKTSVINDGFGRVWQSIDANRQTTTTTYTNNGRTITVTDPLSRTKKIEIDALGRTLKSYDAFNQITTYTYDDANRRATVLTPEGVSVTTTKTRTGEVLEVKDGKNGITKYTYTKDGKLDTVTDAENINIQDNGYDASGRLYESKDANGVITRYSYDATNRIFQKAIDPNGLNIRTFYEYDAQGRQLNVTEGYGSGTAITTNYKYDRKGQIKQIIVDPSGLKLSTTFTYDGLGQTTKVEKGTQSDPAQQTTIYIFDKLGRKIFEKVDPSGLNLTTGYKYDNNGNLIRKTDANNNYTSYVYDAANQLRFTIDAEGSVTENIYDANGNIVRTVEYSNKLSATEIANLTTLQNIGKNLLVNSTFSTPGSNGLPEGWQQSAYRVSGSVGVNLNTTWAVQGLPENDNTAWLHQSGRDGGGAYQDLYYTVPTSVVEGKKYAFSVYTGAHRATVKAFISWYDINGNRLGGTAWNAASNNALEAGGGATLGGYKRLVGEGFAPSGAVKAIVVIRKEDTIEGANDSWVFAVHPQFEEVSSVASVSSWFQSLLKPSDEDRTTSFTYDKANRLRFTVNAEGAVSENIYDANGNVVRIVEYANQLSATEMASLTTVKNIGVNRLTNSKFSDPINGLADGWSTGTTITDNVINKGNNLNNWTLNTNTGENTLYVQQSGVSGVADPYVDISQTQSVEEGQKYSFSAYVGAHRTSVVAYIAWIDANGNWLKVSGFDDNAKADSHSGGSQLSGYKRVFVTDVAPSGAVKAKVTLRKLNTQVGQADSWLFAVRPQFEEVSPAATQPSNWIVSVLKSSNADRITDFTYDKANRQTKTTMAGWYDVSDGQVYANKEGQSDRFQRTIEVTYDDAGNAVANKIRTGSGSADYVYQYKVYDAAGREVYDIDALGYVTGKTYRASGQVDSVSRYETSLGEKTSGYYTKADILATSAISSGVKRTIQYSYDPAGRQVVIVQALGGISSYIAGDINALSNPATPSVRTGSVITTYNYDSLGNVTKQSVVNQGFQEDSYFYYDAANRRVLSVDAENYGTKTEYDALGNVRVVTEYATRGTGTLGSTTTAPTFTANANDRITQSTYDLVGRVKTSSRRLNGTLTKVSDNTYNTFGEIIQSRDAQSNLTQFTYNKLGNVTKIIEPTREVAGASSAGNDPFKTKTNAAPITEFYYDAFGQRYREVRWTSAGRGATLITEHSFDLAGNEIGTKDAVGNWSYSGYDVTGRVIRQRQTITVGGSLNYSHTLDRRFEYDKAGRQTAVLDVINGGTQKSGQVNVYNGYGEVTEERKVWGAVGSSTASLLASATNNVLMNQYFYNKAGWVEYKHSADGYTYFFYDLVGRVTRTEQRETTSRAATDRITETYYDKLGRALVQRLPAFNAASAYKSEATALFTPIVEQSFDRWGNVLSRSDVARGLNPDGTVKASTYTYNQDNQVLTETSPLEQTTINYDGGGFSSYVTRKFTYDTLGHLQKEEQFAYNSANTQINSRAVATNTYNAAGQLTKTTDATNVSMEYIFDAHGNRVGTRDALGYVTVEEHNGEGQVTRRALLRNGATGVYTGSQTTTPTAVTLATFLYDQAGRKYAEGDAVGSYQYYKFDERNNIIVDRNRTGGARSYEFDELNNKTAERLVSSYVPYGTTIVVDSSTDIHRWNYKNTAATDFIDFQSGLAQKHTVAGDSSLTYTYTYNNFGQLSTETLSGTTVTYNYWENGLLKSISDVKGTSSNGTTNTSLYIYGKRGARDVEKHSTTINTPEYVYTPPAGYGSPVTVAATSTTTSTTAYNFYDVRGRLVETTSPSSTIKIGGANYSTTNLASLRYLYDEWGNRRQIQSTFTIPGGTAQTRTEWYAYDAADRVTVEGGVSDGSTAKAFKNASGASQGVAYAYDGAGRRIKEESWLSTTFVPYGGGAIASENYSEHSYSYNDLGLLANVKKRTVYKTPSSGTNYSGYVDQSTYIYDNRGFQTKAVNHSTNRTTSSSYNADGNLSYQLTQLISNGRKEYEQTNYAYDKLGDVISYTLRAYDTASSSNGISFTNNYSYSYINTYTGRQVGGIGVSSSQSGTAKGITINSYDHRGRLVTSQITEVSTANSSQTGYSYKNFSYNASGQIIAKAEKAYGNTTYKTQSYYYTEKGAELANIGQIKQDISPLTAVYAGGATPGSYTVAAGDNLMGIAQALFGDDSLWYLIADANGLSMGPTDAFGSNDIGRNLRIPNSDKVVGNSGSNYKPYNPSEIIGDLTPDPKLVPLPPPKKKGCGVIAQIIMVVVAVAVTIYTAGAAASLFAGAGGVTAGASTMATGMAALAGGTAAGVTIGAAGAISAAAIGGALVGGFVGSLASQAVGVGLGVQDKISLRQAGAAGLTAGFGAAAGAALQGAKATSFLKDGATKLSHWGHAAQGAASYMGAYASNKIAGLETHFNWTDMAVATVSSGITGKTGNGVTDALHGEGGIYGNFIGNMWGSTVSSSLSRLAGRGEKQDWGTMAADAFGNALATKVVELASAPPKGGKEFSIDNLSEYDSSATLGQFDENSLGWMASANDPLAMTLSTDIDKNFLLNGGSTDEWNWLQEMQAQAPDQSIGEWNFETGTVSYAADPFTAKGMNSGYALSSPEQLKYISPASGQSAIAPVDYLGIVDSTLMGMNFGSAPTLNTISMPSDSLLPLNFTNGEKGVHVREGQMQMLVYGGLDQPILGMAGPTTLANQKLFNNMLAKGSMPVAFMGVNPTADELNAQIQIAADKYKISTIDLQGVLNVESGGGIQFKAGKPLVNLTPNFNSSAVGMGQVTSTAVDGLNRMARSNIYSYKSVALDWKVNLDATANLYSHFYKQTSPKLSSLDRAAEAYRGYHDGNLAKPDSTAPALYKKKNSGNY